VENLRSNSARAIVLVFLSLVSAFAVLAPNVRAGYVFGLSVNPTVGSVIPGQMALATVTISTRNSTSEMVSLTAVGATAGITWTFSPSSGTGNFSSTMTLNTLSTTPSGNYTIGVTGTSASGVVRSAGFLLNVQPLPTIGISPYLVSGDLTTSFTIGVNATQVTYLQAYSLSISYNTTVLTITNVSLIGTPVAATSYLIFDNTVTESIGLFTFSVAVLGDPITLQKSASLVLVTFRFDDFGSSPIHLSDITLVTIQNGFATSITPYTTDGSANTGPRPPATSAALVKYKARPSDHNLALSGTRVETFTADVKGLGPADAYVRVVFTIISSGGNLTTAFVDGKVAIGVELLLTATWIAGPEPTRYFVTAQLFYSGDGIHFTKGNSKSFAFSTV